MWSSVQLVCDLSDYSCNYGIRNVPSMAICFSGAFDYVAMIQLLYFTIWSMLALTLDCQSVDCLSKRVMGSFLRTSIFSFWHVGDDIGLQRNVLAGWYPWFRSVMKCWCWYLWNWLMGSFFPIEVTWCSTTEKRKWDVMLVISWRTQSGILEDHIHVVPVTEIAWTIFSMVLKIGQVWVDSDLTPTELSHSDRFLW